MDVAIMGIFFLTMFFFIALGLRLNGMIYFLFSGFIGLGMVVQLLLDGMVVAYVNGAGSTTDIIAGQYFLLVPILMTIISFLGVIMQGRK